VQNLWDALLASFTFTEIAQGINERIRVILSINRVIKLVNYPVYPETTDFNGGQLSLSTGKDMGI